MTRHLKARIDVPAPIRRTVLLHCSASERLAYNSLVAYIRANLVLTGLQGAERGAGSEVSLLHASHLKSARAALDNIRLTCNGGGKQVASLTPDFYREACYWLEELLMADVVTDEMRLRQAKADFVRMTSDASEERLGGDDPLPLSIDDFREFFDELLEGSVDKFKAVVHFHGDPRKLFEERAAILKRIGKVWRPAEGSPEEAAVEGRRYGTSKK